MANTAPKVKLPAGWKGPWAVKPKKLKPARWQVKPVKAAGGKTVYAAKPVKVAAPKKVKLPAQGPAWAKPPKLTPQQIEATFGTGSKVIRAGTGAYVVVDANGKRILGKPGAGTPAAPAGPDDALLAKYADQPWAQELIKTLRSEQTHHEGFVTGQVMPWQQTALQGLANLNQQAAESYKQSVGGIADGLTGAAAAQPGAYMGTPGSSVTSPSNYAQLASAEAMATGASSMKQMSAWQSLMASTNVNTFSQGQVAALSDYAKGLPAVYAEKRKELVDNIDKYIVEQEQAKAELELAARKQELEEAKFAETQRANKVNESIRATNAQTNFLIGAGRLGIDAQAEARRGEGPAQPPADLPEGWDLVPTDDGGWTVRQTPQPAGGGGGGGSEASGTAGGDAGVKGLLGGWVKKPSAKAIANLRRRGAITGSIFKQNGRWYFKATKERAPAKPKAGAKPKPALTPSERSSFLKTAGNKDTRNQLLNAGNKLDKNGKVVLGPDGKPVSDPKKVGQAMWNWILTRKQSFTASNGTIDVELVRGVLDEFSAGLAPSGKRWVPGANIAWQLFLENTTNKPGSNVVTWGKRK